MEQFSQAPVALDTQESISKLSEGVTYVVNGNKSIEAATIPVGSYVRLVNSTITGRSDGIYTVKTAIPVAPATIDNTYFNESAPISGGVANALSDKITYKSWVSVTLANGIGSLPESILDGYTGNYQLIPVHAGIIFTIAPNTRQINMAYTQKSASDKSLVLYSGTIDICVIVLRY